MMIKKNNNILCQATFLIHVQMNEHVEIIKHFKHDINN